MSAASRFCSKSIRRLLCKTTGRRFAKAPGLHTEDALKNLSNFALVAMFVCLVIGGISAPLSISYSDGVAIGLKTAEAKKKEKDARENKATDREKSCSKDDKACNDQNEHRKSEENRQKGKDKDKKQ